MRYPSDIAFTPTVKAIQARRGSRKPYARMESTHGWPTGITDDLARFLSAATSVYLGTSNREMQPYIQHRGGPPGFIRVLDEARFGFADFRGNRPAREKHACALGRGGTLRRPRDGPQGEGLPQTGAAHALPPRGPSPQGPLPLARQTRSHHSLEKERPK